MKATIYHVEINVSDLARSAAFYKDLFGFLGWGVDFENKKMVYFTDGQLDVGIVQAHKDFVKNGFHRKNIGLNHIAFKAQSSEEVDDFCKKFLKKRKIPTLYDTPRKFPQYSKKYYAVYFEDPDRIKLEVAYT